LLQITLLVLAQSFQSAQYDIFKDLKRIRVQRPQRADDGARHQTGGGTAGLHSPCRLKPEG
jgi:hypothetical protein